MLLRDRNLVLLSLAGFGALWGTWGFAFWANALMVRGHGVSVVDAGLVVASFGVGAIVAKPVIGFISDRLGGRRKLPALVCLVLFVATLLLFGQMTTLGGFRLVAPVLGVAAFVYSPMLNVMVAETAGRALAGSALGISNAIGQLGSTIVPLAVGAVYGAHRVVQRRHLGAGRGSGAGGAAPAAGPGHGGPHAMNGRDRRPVGGTGLAVSALGIGGGSLANAGGTNAVRTLLDGAWDRGLRYFDTAALYAAGESERRFGMGLRERPRDDYVLSTKLGRFAGAAGRDAYDYTAAGAERTLAGSMARLGLDRVDIVFIHDLTPALHGDSYEDKFRTCMAGAFPFLDGLRARGIIRAVGIAMADAEVALRFAREARFDCFMLAGGYTLLRHASHDTLLAHCARSGSAVMVAAPFNTGILATGAIARRPARLRARPAGGAGAAWPRSRQTCRRHGVSLAAAALQFPLAHPAVASVVAGHQATTELDANLALLAERIPAGFWAELKVTGLLAEDVPVP